jgi:hypothetical protein
LVFIYSVNVIICSHKMCFLIILGLILDRFCHIFAGSGLKVTWTKKPCLTTIYHMQVHAVMLLRGLSPRDKLYQLSHRLLSAKLVPNFADRSCRMVRAMDSHGRILDFLYQNRYYFFQVAPQLYSWVRVDPVPDPLLLRKSGSAGNRTRTFVSVARKSDTKPQRWSQSSEYGKPTLLGLIERANLNQSSPLLRIERDPVSETLCFLVFRIPDNGQSPETQ